MIDGIGNMFLDEDDIIELMLQNRQVKILPRNVAKFKTFEQQCTVHGLASPFKLDIATDKIIWNTPIEFQNLDIFEYIISKNTLTYEQKQRVAEELVEFDKRQLTNLLRFLVFFVKILKDNNIVYGVGRGSSIASYVLYLLGVHRIDSLKYNLDIKEFLK